MDPPNSSEIIGPPPPLPPLEKLVSPLEQPSGKGPSQRLNQCMSEVSELLRYIYYASCSSHNGRQSHDED